MGFDTGGAVGYESQLPFHGGGVITARSPCGIVRAGVLLALLSISSLFGREAAARFQEGNILVISQEPGNFTYPSYLFEYSPSGARLQTVAIPRPGDLQARDLVADFTGRAFVFNGTFTPFLSVYNPSDASWSHRTFEGWSLINVPSYGGIALAAGAVFVTDQTTFGPGQIPSGIVRFPLEGSGALRFASGKSYIDLTTGLDGLLYALDSQGASVGSAIDVYDPVTLMLLRRITLPFEAYAAAIAVDGFGTVYSAKGSRSGGLSGAVYRLSGTGEIQASFVPSGGDYLTDIDIDGYGNMILGASGGAFFYSNTAFDLSRTTRFQLAWDFVTFVAFVPSNVTPVQVTTWSSIKALFK